jgi:hypothetical protein
LIADKRIGALESVARRAEAFAHPNALARDKSVFVAVAGQLATAFAPTSNAPPA